MITNILFALAVAAAPTNTPAPEVTTCYTPDVIVGELISRFPGTDIKEVAKEPPFYIIFTNPDQATDLKANFDENNCFVDFEELSKTVATE